MPFLTLTESLNLKLQCIPLKLLRELAQKMNLSPKGKFVEIAKRILNNQDESAIDNFIKKEYLEKVKERNKIISDKELKEELQKVKIFSWGIVQGQLDQKIQSELVRKHYKYDNLVSSIKNTFLETITNHILCTWYNHWTTVLIEEHIALHPKVIPTIKNVKGIDIFINQQPFDLKVTYLPKKFNFNYDWKDTRELTVWLYENQGSQRFGDQNRFYVILIDRKNPEKSWELKRDFDFVFQKIDNYLNEITISQSDEIVFSYNKKTYTAIAKTLLITK